MIHLANLIKIKFKVEKSGQKFYHLNFLNFFPPYFDLPKINGHVSMIHVVNLIKSKFKVEKIEINLVANVELLFFLITEMTLRYFIFYCKF